MVNVGLAPFCGAEEPLAIDIVIAETKNTFEKNAAAWGIDLKDPSTQAQYQKALVDLEAKYKARAHAFSKNQKPQEFSQKYASSVKKIKEIEEELKALEQKIEDYRKHPDKAEKINELQAKLKANLEELETITYDLHLYLKLVPNTLHNNVGGFLMALTIESLLTVLLPVIIAVNLTVQSNTFAFYASMVLFPIRIMVIGLVDLFFNKNNNALANRLRELTFPLSFGYLRGAGAIKTQRYLTRIRTELKKLLEPSEQLAAQEILAYAENYGCNVLKDTMQGKPAPKYRIATEPKPTQPTTATKLRIAPEPPAPSAGEVEAAALENQVPTMPVKKTLPASK